MLKGSVMNCNYVVLCCRVTYNDFDSERDGRIFLLKLEGMGFTRNIRCESESEMRSVPEGEVTLVFRGGFTPNGNIKLGDRISVMPGMVDVAPLINAGSGSEDSSGSRRRQAA